MVRSANVPVSVRPAGSHADSRSQRRVAACRRMTKHPCRWAIPKRNPVVQKFRSGTHTSFAATVSRMGGPQGPLLGVPVLTRDDVDGQSLDRGEDDPGLAGEWPRDHVPANLGPALGLAQVVPVEDLDPVPRNGVGLGPAHGPDNRPQAVGRVPDEVPASGRGHPSQPGVRGGDADGPGVAGLVRGVDRRVGPQTRVAIRSTHVENRSWRSPRGPTACANAASRSVGSRAYSNVPRTATAIGLLATNRVRTASRNVRVPHLGYATPVTSWYWEGVASVKRDGLQIGIPFHTQVSSQVPHSNGFPAHGVWHLEKMMPVLRGVELLA